MLIDAIMFITVMISSRTRHSEWSSAGKVNEQFRELPRDVNIRKECANICDVTWKTYESSLNLNFDFKINFSFKIRYFTICS